MLGLSNGVKRFPFRVFIYGIRRRIGMPIQTFFVQKNCDRCGRVLGEKRSLSFFTKDIICPNCSAEEDEIRQKIREEDGDPNADLKYQNIGVFPKLK
jgi:hypothetical protein